MSTRKVDPVHFFDERGHALSSYEVLAADLAKVRAENDRLKRALKAMQRRQAMDAQPAAPTVH